nr:neurofilament medium polypeptide-like isoform X1 [Penaeus vannamei]XP_027218846.1 neurofilament medium polypeptide-like isoform X1 [Penaeus vannamei]
MGCKGRRLRQRLRHQESRDGDDTQGSYYVQLPDGRLQTVKYVVDGDEGYVAEVSYEGEAQYPESHEIREYSSPRRVYSAPESEEEEPREARVYTAPRPRYTAPESKEESPEVSVYTPPEPVTPHRNRKKKNLAKHPLTHHQEPVTPHRSRRKKNLARPQCILPLEPVTPHRNLKKKNLAKSSEPATPHQNQGRKNPANNPFYTPYRPRYAAPNPRKTPRPKSQCTLPQDAVTAPRNPKNRRNPQGLATTATTLRSLARTSGSPRRKGVQGVARNGLLQSPLLPASSVPVAA